MSKQTTLLESYGNTPRKNRYQDTSDDDEFTPSQKKNKKQSTETPPSLFAPIQRMNDEKDYGTLNQILKKRTSTGGRRPNREWGDIQNYMRPSAYAFEAIPERERVISEHELSEFKKNLADMVINGNLRIKFSPKCATREGAKEYVQSKVDDRGYPKYRLIGTNAEDFFGNKICDINGDRVDDVIICDKKGNPVIVNGYKLVQASPYKKVWANIKAANPETTPNFNIWLAEQFNTTKDWSKLGEADWARGKLDWDVSKASERAQAAYSGYKELGLGKPHLNTRLSARALWSSVFSQFIWENVKSTFESQAAYKDIVGLIKLVDYLKVANALYNVQIEWRTAGDSGKQNWIEWTNAKRGNQKQYNKLMGMKVQDMYKQLTKEVSDGTENQPKSLHRNLITQAIKLIKDGFNVESDEATAAQLSKRVLSGNATSKEIKGYKNTFKDNIDSALCKVIPGYKQYLAQKPQKQGKFEDYINMEWQL